MAFNLHGVQKPEMPSGHSWDVGFLGGKYARMSFQQSGGPKTEEYSMLAEGERVRFCRVTMAFICVCRRHLSQWHSCTGCHNLICRTRNLSVLVHDSKVIFVFYKQSHLEEGCPAVAKLGN